MRWTLDQIEEATGGKRLPTPTSGDGPAGRGTGSRGDAGDAGDAGEASDPSEASDEIDGISIDSRSLEGGQLFVAVRAERDGHDFLPAAARAGAVAVLVEKVPEGYQRPAIVVPDTGAALLDLGGAARRRLAGAIVVGITGSVGKTSTKDLAAAVAGATCGGGPVRNVVASPRSFNNELGVPLTLANAPEDADVAVLEMGARGPGHIDMLCRIAAPTVGIVTAVAAAHTEMFGGLDGVAQAKGELIAALPSGGLAILNGDDHRVRAMASRGPAPAILYSASGDASADVRAHGTQLDGQLRPTFRAETPWGATEVTLEARGVHQVGNALAALALAGRIGVDIEAAAGALRAAKLSAWRMELSESRSGATVLNDAYNANPTSTAAALRALASLVNPRKVAVLGIMAELGPRQGEEHLAIANLAADLGIELIPVGTDEYGVPPLDVDDLVARLAGQGPDLAVLVKGSRVAGLEKLAAKLLDL